MSTYRCYYTPKGPLGNLAPSDAGLLPFVQLQAETAERAQRAAHYVTGCPIAEAERLDDVKA
ncbi:hypothetical protein [uncultured Pseudacidovorax sp.]|uniref:hypothetical protein n=1 Tax=uncultured Pseudacidovorax sp. TaxID=679313 RepID=UPI0025E87B4A|nr:hypothetical protein [uncultured Pseudacidovorax sp.]